MGLAAIIVAGGGARRLGGVAKPWLDLAGRPIIEHVIDAVSGFVAEVVIVAQPPIDWRVPDRVRVTSESPAGGGPAAAIRAGLEAFQTTPDEVVLLAGDAPFVGTALARLLEAPLTADGIAVVSDGRVQFLCSRIRSAALHRALSNAGASMHSVFDLLQIDTIEAELRDADTWEDVAMLRREGGTTVSENPWLAEAVTMLEIEPVIDIDAVLALARDVAHNQERKNAPLTAFLLGFAAAQKGYSPAQVAEVAAKLGARAVETGAHD